MVMQCTWVCSLFPLPAVCNIGIGSSGQGSVCDHAHRRIQFTPFLRIRMTTSRDQAPDLFGAPEGEKSVEAPLAERLRPREFADFVGQDDITAPDRPLRRAIEADQISSVIFWGPPGSGKTTLAHLIARHPKAQFVPFSAAEGGGPELGGIIRTGGHRHGENGEAT